MQPRLTLRALSKAYPTVKAVDQVDLTVERGEIHAVLGENGAGKSTLMKMIYGAVRPDSGAISWNGTPVHITTPAVARELGIAMVFQHFSLFDTLTVAENIALGLPRSAKLDALAAQIRATAAEYGLELSPQQHVHTLSVGERQRVEIVRALLGKPQLLILDEPTSVLAPQAVEKLFDTLRLLAQSGCSILYISHKLDEIRRLCHTCTVLRAGRVTGQCDPRVESAASLSRMMLGSDLPAPQRSSHRAGAVVVTVTQLALPKSHPFATELTDISFTLRAGEILGIAGISGNGQQELLGVLSGEDTRADNAMVLLDGTPIGKAGRAQRRARGIAFVPEERLGRGAVPALSLSSNILLSHQNGTTLRGGLIRRRALRQIASDIIARFNVKAGGPEALAQSLSGGNLQKFIVGREISTRPRVLMVAQPTWGVDVGAAAQIRNELIAMRDAGCAVLVISEELDELFEIADRLMVIAKGRVSEPVPIAAASVEQIGLCMAGLAASIGPVQAMAMASQHA